MRRILLLVAVWCYSWMAWAIDGEGVTFDDWRVAIMETSLPPYEAWAHALNDEGMVKIDNELAMEARLETRTVKSPHCPAGGVCGYEHKYILNIKQSPRSQPQRSETIAFYVKDKEIIGDERVVFDIEGKKVIGDGLHLGAGGVFSFVYENMRVLLRMEDITRFGDEGPHSLIALSIVHTNGGQSFQWLGSMVKMVTLSAHVKEYWE